MDDTTEFMAAPVRGRFFRRVDWSAFWTACIAAFAVYFYTLAPTVTLEDSGELAVAGDYLGVPHPPGYPIWTMISWLFARVFSFVTYLGQPNPAWSIGLSSAVFGAIAAGITAMLICRSGSDVLRHSRQIAQGMSETTEDLICWAGGVACSLLFAFSPAMWSQSVIVEVYSLNAFFLVFVFLLSYRWLARPSNKVLYLVSFVFGLGLTNYQVLLLAAMALAIVIMLRDLELFRDFLIVAIVFVVTIVIINLGSLPPMPGFPKHPPFDPQHSTFALLDPNVYLAIFLAASVVVAMCLTIAFRKRPGIPAIPAVVLGVAALTLVILLAGVSAPGELPLPPGKEPFTWGRYYLGFLAAMGALVALCLFIPRGRMLAAAFVTIEVTLAVLVRKGALLSLMHPSSTWFHFYLLLNFAVLGMAFFALPNGRTVALSFLFAELGVSFYVYMPLVSDLRNPPMNWGYPRTWEGFKHAITRGQYEKISPADALSMQFIHQLGSYLSDLRMQFTLLAAPLGFLPFTVWTVRVEGRRIRALYIALALTALAVAFALLEKFLLPGVGALVMMYKLLFLGVLSILFVGFVAILIEQTADLAAKALGSRDESASTRVTAGLVLAGLVLAFLGYCFLMGRKFVEVTAPLRGSLPPNASVDSILLQGAGIILLIIGPILAGGAVLWLMKSRGELRMELDHHSQRWMLAILIGFLAMSVVLIALANPKGDIQDNFIQRVKFISSHALYAFWIGYGLIFSLTFVDNIFKGSDMVKWLTLSAALVLPLIPLHQNGYNAELLRTSGGAEQHGHDFGWQFGNYQLRGADAILEELSPDEEPLPNPHFPPAMGPRAIFFGGTDPGRFVPTYMIYSARVREDVYLITQNALADNTYMSVMRDLYGDEIWIPAQNDSALSFQRYVEEVNAGKRPRNADLTIENGRVQVSGALGVMEINGILAQMIFERNNYRHPFYIEESYVIRWMYPYLTPHGLIMKLNRAPTPLDGATIRNDLDFWDWYARRLTDDAKFERDVVARKSFSKLRSAIGGLYASRGKFAEAEKAFQEARVLYSLSPEANFRLVQEVLMPMRRFEEARDVMVEFGKQDPGNTKIPEFIAQLDRIVNLESAVAALEAKRSNGKMDINDAIALSELYLQSQRQNQFLAMVNGILATPNLPGQYYFRVAQMLDQVGRREDMLKALDLCVERIPAEAPSSVFLDIAKLYAKAQNLEKMGDMLARYVKLEPGDWRAWLDLAAVQLIRKDTLAATRSLDQALRHGGAEAQAIISQDPRFAPIRNAVGGRARDLMSFPGVTPRSR